MINAALYINSALDLVVRIDDQYKYGYEVEFSKFSRSLLPMHCAKVEQNHYDATDGEIVWKINKNMLDKGIPIIAGVDVYYLPYSTNYQKNHANHAFLLTGYSEDESLVNIVDWYEPWFFKGTMEFNEFIKARSSRNPWDGTIYSGTAINNNWTQILSSGWDAVPEDLISQTLNLTIDQFFTNSSDDSRIFGVSALKKILDILQLNKTLLGIERNNFLRDMHKKLYPQSKRHKLFKFYLLFSKQWVGEENIVSAIKQVEELISQWSITLTLLLKASITGSDSLYNKIADHISKIIRFEIKLYDSLYSIERGI
ncbi:BtrH N-terminal domain-containing protein [Paenibacillus pabuli]|uniref:BtrH N-terminal domain-containing protein n=1 Tax=Paenibacillus pabuli TaxID=1472 RepID=UPI0015EB7F65|nr:BtrH N-terminal domain-containing protein [Paenibacillus pabuli]